MFYQEKNHTKLNILFIEINLLTLKLALIVILNVLCGVLIYKVLAYTTCIIKSVCEAIRSTMTLYECHVLNDKLIQQDNTA